jgi:hypothetical protein
MPVAVIFVPNVRDHRWLLVARLVPTERSGVRTRRDAGSHSVDRIVRLFFVLWSMVKLDDFPICKMKDA